jgi:hypothetical protein
MILFLERSYVELQEACLARVTLGTAGRSDHGSDGPARLQHHNQM